VRILIYSANFAPEPVGIGKYSGEMATWLANQGHTVHVVAAVPYYPGWKVHREYSRWRYRRELWRGMVIWRAPLWVPTAPSGIKRILHLLSFAISSLPLMLRQILWRPKLVITVAPAIVCAPAGWLVARACRAQAWLHVQDFEIEIAFKMFFQKSPRLQNAALAIERWMLRRFDNVSTISQRMVERLISKGVDQKRARLFPNWVDISHICPSCDGAAYRAQLGIAPDAVVLLYAGSLGAKQGLMMIPAVAELLSDRADIVFVICGDGVMKQQLSLAVERMPNVHLLPLQPFDRLGELLCMADTHLLPQGAEGTDLVLPSKLSGMLASGRPVVATCRAGSELESVVSRCGIVVRPGEKTALAEAIVTLADDRQARRHLGKRARVWAERYFERDTVLADMFGCLNTVDAIHAVEPSAQILIKPAARPGAIAPPAADRDLNPAEDETVVGF
jgi:colanic acid biosynthesis glycosyl transferase WcaI